MKRSPLLGMLLSLGCGALTAAQPQELVDHSPSSQFGRFDARLTEDDALQITLRVFYDFVDGRPEVLPGYADREYRWTMAVETRFKDTFRQQVEEAWSGQYVFTSPDGARRIPVSVAVREVATLAAAHWRIRARHYPDDAPDSGASVCDAGQSHYGPDCEHHREGPGLTWGAADFASNHWLPDPVRDLEVAPVDIWFEIGSDEPPAGFLELPPSWLVTEADWSALLIGYAGEREATGGATPGEVRPNMALARARTTSVLHALIEHTCRQEQGRVVEPDCEQLAAERIRVVNHGAYGEAPYGERNLVQMHLHRHPMLPTLPHEAGHMIGLGDEASDENWAVGSALPNPNYAALVEWYRHEVVVRHDDEGIMSRGNVVRARHYVTFLEALAKLTGSSDWSIVEP